jgi:hypothetical protein
MGTWWRGILVALVIACGTASAQSYAAVSVGLPVVLVSGHVGFEDLIAPAVDLRVNLGGGTLFGEGFGIFGLAVGADALWRFVAVDEQPWTPYAGGGVGVLLLGAAGGGSVDAGLVGTGAAVAGIDYDLGGLSVFAEVRGELLWNPSAGFLGFPGVRLGVTFPL